MLLVGCLMLLLGDSSAPHVGQTKRDELLDQPVELHLTNATLLYTLSVLSIDVRVPIGFEPSLTHKDRYNLNIDAKHLKLRDVLDMIVRQEPAYRWEARDGVINFVPTQSRDAFVERLLNTRIHRFAPAKGLGKFGIRDAILDLMEIQSLLKANGITAPHVAYVYRPGPPGSEEDLSISETDVRGVLLRELF